MAAVSDSDAPDETPDGVRCDFCGEVVPRVRRIALDGAYDRLRTPHRVQYACTRCSEAKERDRLAGSSS